MPETAEEVLEAEHNEITCHSYVELELKPVKFNVFVLPVFDTEVLTPLVKDVTGVADGFDPELINNVSQDKALTSLNTT